MVIVKRFHYEIHDQLRQHFGDFVAAYNFARRLKACRASRHTNSFAICGRKSHQNLRIIRTTKTRNRTASGHAQRPCRSDDGKAVGSVCGGGDRRITELARALKICMPSELAGRESRHNLSECESPWAHWAAVRGQVRARFAALEARCQR